jgi:peptidoglycan/LPS O-acetylase OafA/YrhL
MLDRFYTLDAMRGVAAISVVIFHVGLVMGFKIFPHGYLAVDFFFMLSGFVLTRAYERKLQRTLSARRFMEMRFVRLYPLFALGVLFGVVTIVGQIFAHSPTALSPLRAEIAFLLNVLMLPALSSPNGLFPFDAPGWSLFFEFVINGLFATVLFRTSILMLAVFCTIAGVFYLYFGLWRWGGGNFGGIWPQIWPGFCRVLFAFPIGILFARAFGLVVRRQSFLALLAITSLTAVLVLPISFQPEWQFDAIGNFLAMPLILWFGAFFELPESMKKFAGILGDISYPLYAIHYPLLQIISFIFVRKMHLAAGVIGAAFLIGCVALSWFLSHHFDAPVRRWLSIKMGLRQSAMPEA